MSSESKGGPRASKKRAASKMKQTNTSIDNSKRSNAPLDSDDDDEVSQVKSKKSKRGDHQDKISPKSKSKDKGNSNSNSKSKSSSKKSSSSNTIDEEYNEPDVSNLDIIDILHLEDPVEVTADVRANMLMIKLLEPITRKKFYTKYWESQPLLIERSNSNNSDENDYYKNLFNIKNYKKIMKEFSLSYGVDIDVSKYHNSDTDNNTAGSSASSSSSSSGSKTTKIHINRSYIGRVIDNDNPNLDGITGNGFGNDNDNDNANTNEDNNNNSNNNSNRNNDDGSIIAKSKDIWDYFDKGYGIRLLCPQKFDDILWSFLSSLEHEFGCYIGCEADMLPGGCSPIPAQAYCPTVDGAESIILQISGETIWNLNKPNKGA